MNLEPLLTPMFIAAMGGGTLSLIIGRRQWMHAFCSVGGVCLYLQAVNQRDPLGQVLGALYTTFQIWAWWNGGGGNNTKRRLRRWARKFSPVRRTAPSLT